MILVVIPAYNEAKTIGRVIRGLFENGLKDIVVVDDGSVDGTVVEAEEMGVKVLRHEINRGQGAALETGDAYAREIGADIVVHFDADDQFNPSDINKAVNFLKEKNFDIVLGSRFLDNRSRLPFLKKVLLLPIARWINFLFTGFLLTDVHNGFRVLSKKALDKIHIKQDRMAHNTEILQQIKRNGLTYAEFPVEVCYHTYGQGAAGGFRIVGDLFLGLFTKK